MHDFLRVKEMHVQPFPRGQIYFRAVVNRKKLCLNTERAYQLGLFSVIAKTDSQLAARAGI